MSFVFDFVFDQYKTQERCDNIISKVLIKLKYFHDRYKAKERCNKVIKDFLRALKFVHDQFDTNKMI